LILLDANALVSLLGGQPAEAEVAELLRRGNCATPAPCLSEVVDRMIRVFGTEPLALSERLGALIDEVLPVVPAGQRIAWRAGELHAAHYHRVRAPLSLADCLLLATAEPDDEIASSDSAVIATARALGVGTIPLLDSQGRLPNS
jgi:predicted nucleic acid-binding protein